MNLQTFYKNFDLLAEAPNGVQKLRELILQLAIQGKLVPQDANDEPASVLLEKIKNEKMRWKAGGKESQVISQNHKLHFILPQSWLCVRLDEVVTLKSGSTIPQELELVKGDIPYLKVGDMNLASNKREIQISSRYVKKNSQIVKALIPANSIVFPKRGGAIATNKKRLVIKDIIVDSNTMAMICHQPLLLDYLFLWFKTVDLWQLNSGTSVPQINNKDLEPLLFTLPPLEEQKRIVAKVDQLMKLCDELEQRQQKKREARFRLNQSALDHMLSASAPEVLSAHWQRICDGFDLLYDAPETIGKLRQSILQLAVQGKLVPQNPNDESAAILLKRINAEKENLIKERLLRNSENSYEVKGEGVAYEPPQGWAWTKINSVCFVTKLAGFEYTKYITLSSSGEIPVIRAQNVKMNRIEKGNILYIDTSTSMLLERSALVKPAILMTFIGAGIGDVALFDEKERWHLAPNVAKLEPFNNYAEKIDPKYLLIFLMSNTGRKEIFKYRKSTAQPSLSMGTIRDINLILPPLNEQKRIIAKIDLLMNLCDDLEAKLAQAQTTSESLMASVVNHLFSSLESENASAALSA